MSIVSRFAAVTVAAASFSLLFASAPAHANQIVDGILNETFQIGQLPCHAYDTPDARLAPGGQIIIDLTIDVRCFE